MDNIINIIKGAAYALFVWLGIKTGTVKVLFYLMVLDSFLGAMKALRLGYKFSFKKLGWGAVSKLSLLLIPMILALIAKGLDMDFGLFVVAAINILIVAEGISCFTNILSIKTKKQIENGDYITQMLHALRKILTGYLQRSLGVLEDDKDKS